MPRPAKSSGTIVIPCRREHRFPSIWGQRKRSISLYGDYVIFATWDNFVVALDARTGRRVWQSNRGGDLYVQNSSGPIVANGMVVAGSTCQVAGHGCYVTGHDVRNGEELWRNEMIPRPGQPGDETWGGAPFEKRWMTGVWGQLTYDPELDLLYYGSSGAGPASEVQRGTIGGTMAGSNTRWAVKPKNRRHRLAASNAAARQLGSGMHVRDDGHQYAGQSRSECDGHAVDQSRCADADRARP